MKIFTQLTNHCNSVAITIFLVIPLLFAVPLKAVERTNEIIAFGDSITLGEGEVAFTPDGARVGGYELDLEALTDARNDHYNVYNYGVAGEVTVEGYQRFNSKIAQYPYAKYVLILEGTNDIWKSISREDTIYNLRAMIGNARSKGMIPIVGTLTPDHRLAGDIKNVPLYNTMIKAMAADEDVVVADLYAAMIDDWETSYVSNDNLHPNRAGYAKMAEVWFAATFVCSIEYLDQCFAATECFEAGGYWYGEFCNPFPASLNGPYLLLRP